MTQDVTTRVVVVGDLHLSPHADGTGEASVSSAIDRLDVTHQPIADALRAAGRAGIHLHVVAGNHDPEWGLPAVGDRLRALLGNGVPVEIHARDGGGENVGGLPGGRP